MEFPVDLRTTFNSAKIKKGGGIAFVSSTYLPLFSSTTPPLSLASPGFTTNPSMFISLIYYISDVLLEKQCEQSVWTVLSKRSTVWEYITQNLE